MANSKEKIKVVDDEKCKATSSNNPEESEYGYWIHINHFLNCYIDCKIYLKSFDHFLERKAIDKYGLILIPLSMKIYNILNVACCIICDDGNCYMCKNLKNIAEGRRSICSCNKGIRDDHAVTRINWFISNFKMCATMKERHNRNSKSKLSKEKNDNADETKGKSGLKETNNKSMESNNAKATSECSQRPKIDYCECDNKLNTVSHPSGITKKKSKVKAKNMNSTKKSNESVASKLSEVKDDSQGNMRKQTEKLLMDDKAKQSPSTSTGAVKKKYGSKVNVCELASDLEILTRDSFSRFVEKFDSLNAFGHQCLFCKILGYYYDGRYCDIIIPEFCLPNRRQTSCEKSSDEKDCFGKQYCLTVENVYADTGVPPKLIGSFPQKQIPLIDLDKGMTSDQTSKHPETRVGHSKKIIRQKKQRMVSCAEEMKKREKKE